MSSPCWTELCAQAGLSLDGDAIEWVFPSQRKQLVRVDVSTSNIVRLWSRVAQPSVVANLLEDADLHAWCRNAEATLVGFRTDRNWLIGEVWVPTAGLTADEWKLYVGAVASACDHMENVMTGRDRE